MLPRQDVWCTIMIPAIVSYMIFFVVSVMPSPLDNPYYSLIPFILLVAFFVFALRFLSGEDEPYPPPYPLLLPHLQNMVYEDVNCDYPQHKGQVKTHYKILNRGHSDSMSWKIDIARKDGNGWETILNWSRSSKKEGLLVPALGERGPFVPSILQKDDRYENKGQMLVRIRYTDVRGKQYCTCQSYQDGIEEGTYINTELKNRGKKFFKNVDMKGNCKDCRWEKCAVRGMSDKADAPAFIRVWRGRDLVMNWKRRK